MNITLPLEKMTVDEQLQMIETIWNDLSKNTESIESPDWHTDVLNGRMKKVKDGTAHFMYRDEVKNNLTINQ